MKKNYEVIETQKEDEDLKLDHLQEQKEEIKNKVEMLIAQIEETQNIGFESKTKIEQLNSEINIAKEKINNNNTNEERFRKEIEDSKKKIEELNQEKNNKASKKENLSLHKEKYETELKEKEEELALLTQKLSAKELEIEEEKKKVEQDINEKYETTNQINAFEINYENLEKREKVLKDEITHMISELDIERLSNQEIQKGFSKIDQSRNKLLKELEKITLQKAESDMKIKDFDFKIIQLNDQWRMKDSRLKFLQ